MRVLDAKRGIVDEPNLFKRRASAGTAETVRALRFEPAATLGKRAPSRGPAPAIKARHFRIEDMDESDGSFSAHHDEDLDEDSDFDATAAHFKDHSVVHIKGDADLDDSRDEDDDEDDDLDESRPRGAGRIHSTKVNRKERRITVRGRLHDEAARRKVASGVVTHLEFKTRPVGDGHKPVSARLADSSGRHEVSNNPLGLKMLKLHKRDGRIVEVQPQRTGSVAIGAMAKRDGTLDSFKAIHRAGPKVGRF